MWSVPSRRSEPSTAVRMFAGLLSRLPGAAAGVGDETELRRQDDVVAAVLDGLADELLVGEGAVDLGGVDEGDAQVERPVDGADGLGVVGARAGVGGGHAHGAETDAADVECPEIDVLHDCLALDWFRATAARISALNAVSLIFSPSWKSMARRVFPSRLELKRPEGSFRAAPFGERHLHDALVGLAGAEHPVVVPRRNSSPLPLLDDIGIGFLHQGAEPAERLAPPVAELLDPLVDELRRGLALL